MMQEGVVILHGIFRTHRSMRGLARHLEKEGYAVCNIRYPSTRKTINDLADHIHAEVTAFSEAKKLHFVGYSMGGLLIRAYLDRYQIASLGRVVMLGTPNAGSEVADFIGNWKFYRWL